jgi:type I restriction enzyme, S subunit
LNTSQLLALFDRISDAPDAIPRLRQFILDLAMRGKLVEQDPTDEPALELLARIAREKAAVVKAGAGKKPERRSTLETKLTIELPIGWALAPLESLCMSIADGDHLPPPKTTGGIPFLVIGNVRSKSIDFNGCRYVSADYFEALPSERRPQKGDVLYTLVGSLGIPIAINDDRPFCIQRHIGILRPSASLITRYLARALESRFVFDQASRCATGIAQKTVPLAGLRRMGVPLPPLAEQCRIVSKMDELMALCDRLEAAQAERESRRDRLVSASLNRLSQPAADANAFREHSCFHFRHLPRLTTRLEHVQQLRHTILNLAVRGQLVHQDPTDAPASELLKRIQSEKARLLKEGKIGRQAPAVPAEDSELSFALQPGWRAARVSEVLVELQTGPFGSSLHQSDYQVGGVPVVNPASIKNERLVPVASMAIGVETLERLASFKLCAGDIVMARRGEMGRCAVVTEKEDGWLCGTGSLILRLPECVYPRFLVTVIGSPFVRTYLGGSAVGATMQNLNQSILLNLVIGLPPLKEQHRIVAKVDELMAVCDRLEAQLTITQTERRRLLEAVLRDALNDSRDSRPISLGFATA